MKPTFHPMLAAEVPNVRTQPATERSAWEEVQAAKAANPRMSPLEYMLNVMCDPTVDASRRDRMAIAAAPFCHGKIMDKYVGKKEAQEEESATAAQAWMRDLTWREGDRAS